MANSLISWKILNSLHNDQNLEDFLTKVYMERGIFYCEETFQPVLADVGDQFVCGIFFSKLRECLDRLLKLANVITYEEFKAITSRLFVQYNFEIINQKALGTSLNNLPGPIGTLPNPLPNNLPSPPIFPSRGKNMQKVKAMIEAPPLDEDSSASDAENRIPLLTKTPIRKKKIIKGMCMDDLSDDDLEVPPAIHPMPKIKSTGNIPKFHVFCGKQIEPEDVVLVENGQKTSEKTNIEIQIPSTTTASTTSIPPTTPHQGEDVKKHGKAKKRQRLSPTPSLETSNKQPKNEVSNGPKSKKNKTHQKSRDGKSLENGLPNINPQQESTKLPNATKVNQKNKTEKTMRFVSFLDVVPRGDVCQHEWESKLIQTARGDEAPSLRTICIKCKESK